MLITKEVEVGLTGNNTKHLEKLGYEIPRSIGSQGKLVVLRGTKIIIKVEDLLPNSEVMIDVICDYCLEEGIETHMFPLYKDYNIRKNKGVIKKDCCKLCISKKNKESNLINYGVESTNFLQSTQDKKVKTNMEKYGVDHPMKTKEIQEKVLNTNTEKYGTPYLMQSEEIQNRTKKSNMKKYGVEWHVQSDEIRRKIAETNLNKYGVENIFGSEEFKIKNKQHVIDKYGVEYYMQVPEIKDRAKQTMLKNHGVEYAFQSSEIREMSRQTNLEKYGVEYPMQNEEIRQKQRDSVYKSGKVASSKQQRYINNLYNGELNYYANEKCFVDIGLLDENIYIEIDCSGHRLGVVHGQISEHNFKEREKRRSYGLIKSGLREMRIISLKDYLPSDEVLLEMLEYAKVLFNDYDFHRVVFDIDTNEVYTSKWKIDYDFGELRSLRNIDI